MYLLDALKKNYMKSIIIVIVLLSLLFIDYILSPYIIAMKVDCELLSHAISCPVEDDTVNVPFKNGNAIIFIEQAGHGYVMKITDAHNYMQDHEIPKVIAGVYKTLCDAGSDPIVVIQENPTSLKVFRSSGGKSKQYTSLKYAEPMQALSISNKFMVCAAFDKNIRGESIIIPKLVSLKDNSVHSLSFKKDESLSIGIICGDKIICSYGLKGENKIYLYSLLNKSVEVIGQYIDGEPFPFNWTSNGDIISWSDRRDGAADKNNKFISNYDIFYYDFNRHHGGILVSSKNNKLYPHLYSNYIFWADDNNYSKSGYDIYVKNIQTGAVKLIISSADDDVCPVYSNGYLYWSTKVTSVFSDLFMLAGKKYVFRKKVMLP